MVMFKTSVKPAAVRIGLIGVAILALLNVLARFGIWDLTASSANIITLFISLALLTEVGLMSMFRGMGRRRNVLAMIAAIVAVLAFIGAATGLFGFTINALQPIAGLVDLLLAIFVIVAIFSKQV